MKKAITGILSIMLVLATTFPAAAVSSTTKSTTLKPITITMLVNDTSRDEWNKQHNSPIQKEIARVTGVTLDYVVCDQTKTDVIIASGDLPDMLQVDQTKYADRLIKSKAIIPMDDLIKTNGKDLQKNIPQTLSLIKNYNSYGTSKIYYLTPQLGQDSMGQEDTIGPTIRMDYYAELGYPQINSTDDLLSMLDKMVKLHPKTSDGKNVYGVGFWSDWVLWPYNISMDCINGKYEDSNNALCIDNNTGKVVNNYTDINGDMWKGIDFFYKANKLGILDKDSFVMKFADYGAKCTSGQELFSFATWATGDFNKINAADGKGFMVVPMNFGSQWNGANYPAGWAGKDFMISKSCKTPSRAMDLINYLYSFDGCRTLYSGVKGVNWDTKGGVSSLTEQTMKLNGLKDEAWKNTGIQSDINIIGLNPYTINPADKLPLSLFEMASSYKTGLSKLQQNFCNHYKVSYPGEVFKNLLTKKINSNQANQDQLSMSLMAIDSDDMSRIITKLKDIAFKGAAKCILSKTDAEYKANTQKVIADLKAAGSDKYYASTLKRLSDAQAKTKKINGK